MQSIQMKNTFLQDLFGKNISGQRSSTGKIPVVLLHGKQSRRLLKRDFVQRKNIPNKLFSLPGHA